MRLPKALRFKISTNDLTSYFKLPTQELPLYLGTIVSALSLTHALSVFRLL